jgi:hypothetical protein
MSRVELLRAGSLKAEARYQQELSSIRSLRHEEAKERHRVAETRDEFWKQAAAAASPINQTNAEQSPLSPSERMWRAHEGLRHAAAKHGAALGKLEKGSERLACSRERVDILQKMITLANRQRTGRLENQRSDELGDMLVSLIKTKRSARGEGEYEPLGSEIALSPTRPHVENLSAVDQRQADSFRRGVEHRPVHVEGVSSDPALAVQSMSSESSASEKKLTVECSFGANGGLSVALMKRNGEAMRAVVSPETNQLALLVQRDKALVISRLKAMGVRVGSVSVGDKSAPPPSDRAGQRMKRRSREDEDESRIA